VILYVLRLIAAEEIPLNEGMLQAVKIHIPENTLLNPVFDDDPEKCPAVVGGNVELSQRLTDTLLKAFAMAACSQGTMNNVLFGNDNFGFYETICGGVGATENGPGANAVHQHMTNTRITDPEIMEFRYPVAVQKFAIRKNSGGHGKNRGGDGVVRELLFKEPVTLTVLTQHRKVAPYGMAGGEAGKCGKQYLIRSSGQEETLEYIDTAALEAGDKLVIETPGGGGYG
jgi:5-oxoprolinase (ATP-hydrolysing)